MTSNAGSAYAAPKSFAEFVYWCACRSRRQFL